VGRAIPAFRTALAGVNAPSYSSAQSASCSRPRWGRGWDAPFLHSTPHPPGAAPPATGRARE